MTRFKLGLSILLASAIAVASSAASADDRRHRGHGHWKNHGHFGKSHWRHGHRHGSRIIIVPRVYSYPKPYYYGGSHHTHIYVVPRYGTSYPRQVYIPAPAATLPTGTYDVPAGAPADGSYCREWQGQIVIGGRTENAYGTACLQPDGSWKFRP